MVQYISSVGPVIRLFDQNFVAGTITVLDEIPLVVPSGRTRSA
jgi:fumarylacetoacetate (FAA) hydrolase family protein